MRIFVTRKEFLISDMRNNSSESFFSTVFHRPIDGCTNIDHTSHFVTNGRFFDLFHPLHFDSNGNGFVFPRVVILFG